MKLPSCRCARPKQKMHPTHHLRRISRLAGGLLVLFAVATGMHGQNLPPTPPTALPGPGAPQTPPQTPGAPQPAAPAPDPPRHAEVIITHGLLQIRADNSSLNQILRSISHITGMKITGGVEEQRVFWKLRSRHVIDDFGNAARWNRSQHALAWWQCGHSARTRPHLSCGWTRAARTKLPRLRNV